MTQHWVGFVAAGKAVTVVAAEIPDGPDDPIVITYDETWNLQKGDRPQAYTVLHQRCVDFLRENKAELAVIKASALTRGGMSTAHLNGAEVRGIVTAAAASACPVKVLQKALISRTYGERKVDEYLKDDAFWQAHTIGGDLRIGSREAAMLLVAERNGK